MSVTDTIGAWVKLEFNNTRSFEIDSSLIAKSIQQYHKNSSTKSDALKLLFEIE